MTPELSTVILDLNILLVLLGISVFMIVGLILLSKASNGNALAEYMAFIFVPTIVVCDIVLIIFFVFFSPVVFFA